MTANEEHIFSAEYAAKLVQRARDGATLTFRFGMTRQGLKPHWLPKVAYGKLGSHWAAWYRETLASWALCDDVIEQCRYVDGIDTRRITDNEIRALLKPWLEARGELGGLIYDFKHSVLKPLGSLCRLPDEWAEVHREEARRIGGGDG